MNSSCSEVIEERGGQHDLDLVVRSGNHTDVGGNLDGAVGGDVAANHAVRGKTQGADEGKRGLLVHGLDLSVIGNLDGAGKAGVEDLELGSDVGDDALCDLGRGLGGSVVGVDQNSLALTVDGVVLGAAVKANDGGSPATIRRSMMRAMMRLPLPRSRLISLPE